VRALCYFCTSVVEFCMLLDAKRTFAVLSLSTVKDTIIYSIVVPLRVFCCCCAVLLHSLCSVTGSPSLHCLLVVLSVTVVSLVVFCWLLRVAALLTLVTSLLVVLILFSWCVLFTVMCCSISLLLCCCFVCDVLSHCWLLCYLFCVVVLFHSVLLCCCCEAENQGEQRRSCSQAVLDRHYHI